MEHLEWADAEKRKITKVLEKEYQDVLDLNRKEYAGAQKEVVENLPGCASHVPRSLSGLISFV
jgi:hypothetical protein